LKIRSGIPDDIPGVSRVYVESWRTTYQDLAPPAFVDGISEASASKIFQESLGSSAHSYFMNVVEQDGRIVGFADGGKERSHPERGIGELYAIYLLKEVQGQGIGRALFEASRASLRQAGMDRMVVWVLEESPARKFYEALGGKLLPGVKTLEFPGLSLKLAAYGWEGKS
jgi:GNAT superfamily N-acetyltransferase